jgi:hypothetical protein
MKTACERCRLSFIIIQQDSWRPGGIIHNGGFLTEVSRIFLRANDLDWVIIGMISASVYDSGTPYT